MNPNPLKQRLVGAIVLVALAVIFIPLFLSGERDDGAPLFGSDLPSKPVELTDMHRQELTHTVPEPEPPAEIRTLVDRHSPPAAVAAKPPAQEEGEAASQLTESQPASTTVETTAVAKSEAGDQSAPKGPHAWVVQIGSFSSQTNALKLRDEVREQGFRAFVEAVTSANGRIFRVRVGPEAERSKAETLRTQLASKAKVKGIVVVHP